MRWASTEARWPNKRAAPPAQGLKSQLQQHNDQQQQQKATTRNDESDDEVPHTTAGRTSVTGPASTAALRLRASGRCLLTRGCHELRGWWRVAKPLRIIMPAARWGRPSPPHDIVPPPWSSTTNQQGRIPNTDPEACHSFNPRRLREKQGASHRKCWLRRGLR